MSLKQFLTSVKTPDGSIYVTLTDGQGRLVQILDHISGTPVGLLLTITTS